MQSSFAQLSKLIGYPVSIEPEWQLLWTELQKSFPDAGTFVPEFARGVVLWCNTLNNLADDESNESWTELLLEKLSNTRVLKVVLEVSWLKYRIVNRLSDIASRSEMDRRLAGSKSRTASKSAFQGQASFRNQL